jgi:dephospho-CoA kinase
MISIGVTGGIGSGKSIVCKILEHLGYPVFYSDEEAKLNMVQNLDLISGITSLFGKESYIDKNLNRSYIATEIFRNPNLKNQLNKLVHPTVFQSFEKWKSKQKSDFVFNESALLFETGSFRRFDQIMLVNANLETRVERIIMRDGISEKQILERISNQLSDEVKLDLFSKECDGVIITNDKNSTVLPQVLSFLEKLKS